MQCMTVTVRGKSRRLQCVSRQCTRYSAKETKEHFHTQIHTHTRNFSYGNLKNSWTLNRMMEFEWLIGNWNDCPLWFIGSIGLEINIFSSL